MDSASQPNDQRIQVAQTELSDQKKGKVQKYADLVVGRPGLAALLLHELVMFWGFVPGALGLFIRSKLYPLVLGACGRNVTFGQNVVLRHPHKIRIGNDVVVDDNVLLDAKGLDNHGIVLEDGVFIGRNTIFSCKNGDIHLGERANVGFNCEIFAADEVRVGKDVMLAAYVYLVGGDHMHDRLDIPVSRQGRIGLPINIGDGCWLGAHAVVAGGVDVGEHAIIGAGAIVLETVPAYHIAAGVPAKPVRDRREHN
jgi:acetyltransferase-like isoleucine patch superfamily enzyme